MNKYFHNSSFNLYLDKSNIPDAGLGVFTSELIPKNTYIDEYIGEIYNFNPIGFYVLEVDNDYYIDGRKFPRCYMTMLNDCSHITKKIIKRKKKRIDKTPEYHTDLSGNKLKINCEFIKNKEDKTAKVFSNIDITPNTELFISYGPNYWS